MKSIKDMEVGEFFQFDGDLFMMERKLHMKVEQFIALCIEPVKIVPFQDESLCFPMCGAELEWWLEEGD